ncbi:MAG: peptidylprolyl isomerase [Panacagrimonas sp.]
MKTSIRWLPGFAGLLLAVPVALAADLAAPAESGLEADVFVNGQPISRNHLLLATPDLKAGASARGLGEEDARAAARTELITQELLAQEALKDGLLKNPVVADQLAFQQRAILSRAYLETFFARNPVTDTELKTAWEWKRANNKILDYKVRHVLTATSDDAFEVLSKLEKGEDFVALAKRYTLDPGGQNDGGDLGWFRPAIFVDHHFNDAVEVLKKGQYSKTPVRSRFGWHVIFLEDGPRVAQDVTPFDQLEDNIKDSLRQKTAQLRIEELTGRLSAKAKLSGPGVGTKTAAKAAK